MPHIGGGKGGAGTRLAPACVTLLLALGLASPAAWCDANDSPLRKFEKGAQPPASQPAPAQPAGQNAGSGDSNEHHDDWLGDVLDFLFSSPRSSDSAQNAGRSVSGGGGQAAAPSILDIPADLTMARLDPRTDITVRRDEGDILIPYARYDFGYQTLSAGIHGYDNRLEAGFGVVSVLFEDYRLYDRNFGVGLTVDRYLLQYRISVNRRSEFDFGIGQTDLMGATLTQLGTVSVTGRIMLVDNLLLELRPAWARTVQDYDGALVLTLPYWSLKAGYRSMTSPGGTLQGPYIGFALHY
jgi:hypothetical protein